MAASRETRTLPPRRPGDLPEDPYTQGLRASVRQTLERAKNQLQGMGVQVRSDLGTVPVLVCEATKRQVQALATG